MYMRDKQKNLTNSLQTAYKHLTLFLQEACYDSIVELESLRKITDSLQMKADTGNGTCFCRLFSFIIKN